jgi:GntR family transcriptional regulator
MILKINLRSETPLYQQIIQAIKQQVATGDLKAGSQIPTIRALAKQLRVHVNTVARAYTALDQTGVISVQQGRGTYITEWPDHAKMRTERHAELHRLIGYTVVEALSLGYSHEEIEGAFAESVNHWRREHRRHAARKSK